MNDLAEPPAPGERPPLTVLAARTRSPVLARIIHQPKAEHGPPRVAVAAFQSAV